MTSHNLGPAYGTNFFHNMEWILDRLFAISGKDGGVTSPPPQTHHP